MPNRDGRRGGKAARRAAVRRRTAAGRSGVPPRGAAGRRDPLGSAARPAGSTGDADYTGNTDRPGDADRTETAAAQFRKIRRRKALRQDRHPRADRRSGILRQICHRERLAERDGPHGAGICRCGGPGGDGIPAARQIPLVRVAARGRRLRRGVRHHGRGVPLLPALSAAGSLRDPDRLNAPDGPRRKRRQPARTGDRGAGGRLRRPLPRRARRGEPPLPLLVHRRPAGRHAPPVAPQTVVGALRRLVRGDPAGRVALHREPLHRREGSRPDDAARHVPLLHALPSALRRRDRRLVPHAEPQGPHVADGRRHAQRIRLPRLRAPLHPAAESRTQGRRAAAPDDRRRVCAGGPARTPAHGLSAAARHAAAGDGRAVRHPRGSHPVRGGHAAAVLGRRGDRAAAALHPHPQPDLRLGRRRAVPADRAVRPGADRPGIGRTHFPQRRAALVPIEGRGTR